MSGHTARVKKGPQLACYSLFSLLSLLFGWGQEALTRSRLAQDLGDSEKPQTLVYLGLREQARLRRVHQSEHAINVPCNLGPRQFARSLTHLAFATCTHYLSELCFSFLLLPLRPIQRFLVKFITGFLLFRVGLRRQLGLLICRRCGLGTKTVQTVVNFEAFLRGFQLLLFVFLERSFQISPQVAIRIAEVFLQCLPFDGRMRVAWYAVD